MDDSWAWRERSDCTSAAALLSFSLASGICARRVRGGRGGREGEEEGGRGRRRDGGGGGGMEGEEGGMEGEEEERGST